MTERSNSIWQRFRAGLSRTRQGLTDQLRVVLGVGRRIDEAVFEELEEVLLTADFGLPATQAVMEELRASARRERLTSADQLRHALRHALVEALGPNEPLRLADGGLSVVLVVGVNGVGKTTTIGKLAARLQTEGRRVILAAGDTFRAAAAEQLEIWGRRAQVDVVRGQEGSDPAAVLFDAIQAARSRQADVVVADTAGRLHTRSNLMEELKKVARVAGREVPGAPHEVLLVLDATTGQNGLAQARTFTQAVGVTGLVVSKLDGTARGGIVLAIRRELGLPVKYAGVGEALEDLRPFDAEAYVDALIMTPG